MITIIFVACEEFLCDHCEFKIQLPVYVTIILEH